jgi:hypothetical protein
MHLGRVGVLRWDTSGCMAGLGNLLPIPSQLEYSYNVQYLTRSCCTCYGQVVLEMKWGIYNHDFVQDPVKNKRETRKPYQCDIAAIRKGFSE